MPCPAARTGTCTGEHTEDISFEAWEDVGVTQPEEEVFQTKTDEGSNMIKGYQKLGRKSCTCHKIETDVKVFVEDDGPIATIVTKCRALVGFFNSSTIGKAELKKTGSRCGYSVALNIRDVRELASGNAGASQLRADDSLA